MRTEKTPGMQKALTTMGASGEFAGGFSEEFVETETRN